MSPAIDQLLDRLATRPFRAKFRLGQTERALVQAKGLDTIRHHAHELIAARLAPAQPINDGKQTPFRGHPVFIAQHATATCCRTCLRNWHDLEPGRALSQPEQDYVVEVIMGWIGRQLDGAAGEGEQTSLWRIGGRL
jgi:hypothetical protein